MNDWLIIAEWDWVLVDDQDDLHAIHKMDEDPDEDWGGIGTTECGVKGDLRIPGLGDRLGGTRCPLCCNVTGMPQGVQSPKNIEACRPIAEKRIERLINT